jgi:tetratricopeptide (TPR) repeat protein
MAYYKIGDYYHALAELDQALKLNSEDGEGYYSRGLGYARKREKGKARADFQKVVELTTDPSCAGKQRKN